MLFDIAVILLPLFLGYLIPLKSQRVIHWVNLSCSQMVYVILFLMGYGLAFIDNLDSNVMKIAVTSLTFILTLSLCNLGALVLIHKRLAMPETMHSLATQRFSWHMLKDSMLLVTVVGVGLVCGLVSQTRLPFQDQLSDYALMLLLLLIGIQLRSSGIKLREILLNRRGFALALIVILSSLPAALLCGWWLELPSSVAIAMASGYGWYSLSGILISDGADVLLGSSAFFIDLSRELLAIVLIPLLMPRFSSAAIGYSGATAMDFTLPILQKSGGPNAVPIAIVSGFLLSLASPLMIAICLSI